MSTIIAGILFWLCVAGFAFHDMGWRSFRKLSWRLDMGGIIEGALNLFGILTILLALGVLGVLLQKP